MQAGRVPNGKLHGCMNLGLPGLDAPLQLPPLAICFSSLRGRIRTAIVGCSWLDSLGDGLPTGWFLNSDAVAEINDFWKLGIPKVSLLHPHGTIYNSFQLFRSPFRGNHKIDCFVWECGFHSLNCWYQVAITRHDDSCVVAIINSSLKELDRYIDISLLLFLAVENTIAQLAVFVFSSELSKDRGNSVPSQNSCIKFVPVPLFWIAGIVGCEPEYLFYLVS